MSFISSYYSIRYLAWTFYPKYIPTSIHPLSLDMAENGSSGAPPLEVTNAVLVKSEEMPKDAQKVEELDFNKLKGPITAEDLYLGMRNMGFQATSMSEAIRIINDMVCTSSFSNQNPS